jgi:hypothetical protein
MATYRDELLSLSIKVNTARDLIKEQIINLLNKQISRALTASMPNFKEDIEKQLDENPTRGSVNYTFCIGDEIFDVIDMREQDHELRLEAFTSAVITEIKALGWDDFRIKSRVERSRYIARLIGIRTYYAVEVSLPITMSTDDMDLLTQFGINSMIAASKFIDRIKTGVLKPTEEPGAHFRRLAEKAGVTPKEALEDVERIHTGQAPRYIKIEKGANEHGSKNTRQRQ